MPAQALFTKTALSTTAAVFLAGSASATLVAYEPYPIGPDDTLGEYPDGERLNGGDGNIANLVTQGFTVGPYGGGTGTSQNAATSLGLRYPAIAGVGTGDTATGKVTYTPAPLDNIIRSNARNLSLTPGTSTVWISHLVNRGNIPQDGGNGFNLTGFGNAVAPELGATSGDMSGLFVGYRQDGTAGDFGDLIIRYRDNIANNTDEVLVDGAVNSTFGLTYHVLMKADINVSGSTDAVTYWVNPSDLSSEAALTSSAAITGGFNSFAFQDANDFARLNYSSQNWNGSVFFDEAILATDLADIAAIIPEPASVLVLGLGGAAVAARRRRAEV